MTTDTNHSRRKWLALVGLLGAGTPGLVQADDTPTITDSPRDLKPSGADLGSLFGDVEKLVPKDEFAGSYLTNRFKTLDAFKTAGREVILDAGRYRPEKVAPKAEVLARLDRK